MKIFYLSVFFASLIFLIIDVLWLSISVKLFYRPQIGLLLNEKPIFWAAILFYLVYIFGIAILIIQPSLNNDSMSQSFWTGLILGVVAYGTYNLTNMATIKNWSVYVVVVDMAWGGFLTGFSSSLGIFYQKNFLIKKIT